MYYGRARTAFNLLACFVLFQLAASASAIFRPGYDLADLSLLERLSWFAGWITNWHAYAYPVGIFFVYVASIKWLFIDRRTEIGWVRSAAYYVSFGLFYGALFVNGLNGELHGKFDRALGIEPGPFVSAMFPLSLAFLFPLLINMLIRIISRRQLKAA